MDAKNMVVVVLVASLLTLSDHAVCQTESREYVIPRNDYRSIHISMSFLDKVELTFLTDGAPVDVLFMNETLFGGYVFAVEKRMEGSIFYFKGESRLNSTRGDIEYRAVLEDDYVIVFDNTDLNGKGAMGQREVVVRVDTKLWVNPLEPWEAVTLFVLVVASAVAFIAIRSKMARKKLYSNRKPVIPVVVTRTVTRRVVMPG